MNIHIKPVSIILRIFVGLVFITSAILKYVSVDAFDLYVYEHNLFSVSVTETLTRLLITIEAVLGIMLVFNIFMRTVYYAVLFFLTGFTVYLLIIPFFFDLNPSNCYCFGEAIVLTHTESIIKNVILMLCMMFVSTRFYSRRRWESMLTGVLSVAIFSAVIIGNAPNYLYSIVHKRNIQIDLSMYETALQNSGKERDFSDGKQIICMYTVFCKFCRRSAVKLHLLLKNNHLSEDNVKAIFWSDTPENDIREFFSEQNLIMPDYTTFRVDTFLLITNGRMPIFLFVDNGTIIHQANYISLDEKEVVDFFKKKK